MTFLHPALLWLVPLAAIPVLLHLLTLHRLKTVELSTFRFLFDSYVQQRRQIKFLEALLAILRTLFLLFLIFVVSRPVVKQWSELFGGASGGEVIMIVDCSASMNARTGGLASIDRARSVALALQERLDPEDRLTLVRLTSRADVIFSRFSSDTAEIRDKIESIATSPSRANLYAGLNDLFAQTQFRKPGQTVYLFTDCQSSAWREVKDQSLTNVVPADTDLRVINVGSNTPIANRAVVGEPPGESRVVVGLPVVLRPKLVNHSKTDPASVTVGVVVNEKEVDRLSLTLQPGESATREVVYIPREPGLDRCRFEISGDAFPDDDAFLFALHVTPAVKVLIVNGSPSKDPLESESLFLQTALQSRPDRPDEASRAKPSAASPDLTPGDDFLRSLDVHEITEPQLNQQALDGVSVVMLANCGSLNDNQFQWLREHVGGGGGLAILPGDKVNRDTYNQRFLAQPGAAAAKAGAKKAAAKPKGKSRGVPLPQRALVEATLGVAAGELDKAEQFERLTSIDFAHPIFSVFEDPQYNYLTTAHFFRRYPLEMAEDRSGTWPLAHFTGGSLAIVESHFGDGIVLLAAFPASPKWSNLPLKPEFVPLVLRIASYVMRRSDVETPSVVPAGGVAEIAVDSRWGVATARVTEPNQRSSVVALERSEGMLAGAFENTAEKGFYAVEVTGGTNEQPRRGTLAFAVNLAPDESNFAMISPENLRDWLPGVETKLIDASAQAHELQGPLGDDREIWRPLIVLMFVIIGVEFMLSTLGGLRGKDEPTVGERIRNINPGAWVGRMTGAAERVE
jgi:hypothetical protein